MLSWLSDWESQNCPLLEDMELSSCSPGNSDEFGFEVSELSLPDSLRAELSSE